VFRKKYQAENEENEYVEDQRSEISNSKLTDGHKQSLFP
jgi:hypothetical protein